jgi:dTDP-4-amino-4,6-dideoxygalactose transaminase
LERKLPDLAPDWLPSFAGLDVEIFPTHRGREAQYALLRGLGLPSGARVGVPLFTHPVVWQTIVAAGMQPVFLDSDARTFGLSLADLQAKRRALDCLILVHTFGYPADFDSICALMDGKPVLEDCAHALGSTHHGRPLGALAAGAFFTFLFSKPLSAGGGGCAVARGKPLREKVARLLGVGARETFRQGVCHAAANFLAGLAYRKPWYSLLTRVTSSPFYRRVASQARYPVSPALRMRPTDWSVVALRLANGGAHKARNSNFWASVRACLPEGWRIPPEPAWGEWNHWLMPVGPATEESAAQGVARLRGAGIGARWMYYYSPEAARACGYQGDCPEAERLARTVFVLPAHAGLTFAERQHILRCLTMLGAPCRSYGQPRRLRPQTCKPV